MDCGLYGGKSLYEPILPVELLGPNLREIVNQNTTIFDQEWNVVARPCLAVEIMTHSKVLQTIKLRSCAAIVRIYTAAACVSNRINESCFIIGYVKLLLWDDIQMTSNTKSMKELRVGCIEKYVRIIYTAGLGATNAILG